jgi:hypothetical protein
MEVLNYKKYLDSPFETFKSEVKCTTITDKPGDRKDITAN